MTETEVAVFERKLKQLKEEESLILKLLKDVQKQMKKYEVEELQTCSESIIDKSDEEDSSDSDYSVSTQREFLRKVFDCAEFVNDSELNLGIKRVLGVEVNNEESEETDDSDECQ